MCPLIFGSFTYHQVVILREYLAIVTQTEKSQVVQRTPMVKVPHSLLLDPIPGIQLGVPILLLPNDQKWCTSE